MEEKECTKCNSVKPLTEFHKRKEVPCGYVSWCKSCRKVVRLMDYYVCGGKERESNSAERKQYRKDNKSKISIRRRSHYIKNKEKNNEQSRLYSKNNRDRINELSRKRQKERKKTDPLYKLQCNIRCRVLEAFKSKEWTKSNKTQSLLGAEKYIVSAHMERQFKKGMNWSNHGNGHGKWNIDHKIPLSIAKTKEELRELCHYTNLQPLWWIDNLKKKDKILAIQTTLTI